MVDNGVVREPRDIEKPHPRAENQNLLGELSTAHLRHDDVRASEGGSPNRGLPRRRWPLAAGSIKDRVAVLLQKGADVPAHGILVFHKGGSSPCRAGWCALKGRACSAGFFFPP